MGEEVLAKGGNAVDAAVAVGFALAVTWPEAGNIGGGGFMLVRPAGAKSEPIVVDYRETAPAAATRDLFVKNKRTPHLTVGVPGTVAGLALAHRKFGKLPWKDLVAPAVELAEEGFVIDAALAGSLNRALARAKGFPGIAARLRQGRRHGARWQAGDRLVQKDLAQTLRRIAEGGADGFYKGETADLLVAEMKAGGGLITKADLAAYTREGANADPRHLSRLRRLRPAAAESAGGICLVEMLNILENFDLKKQGPLVGTERLHLMVETMRRAYCDRAQYLGDSDFVKIPAHLTTKEYAQQAGQGHRPQEGHAQRRSRRRHSPGRREEATPRTFR